MNLLDGMMTRCVRLMPTQTPDGLGGYAREWTPGAAFDAAIIRGKAEQTAEGQRMAPVERFTVVTPGDAALGYHDVFRRLSDGRVFRVTGAACDAAPAASTVNIAAAECERWDAV